MAVRKKHLLMQGFLTQEDFATKRTGRSPLVPERDPASHGQNLLNQYVASLEGYDLRQSTSPPSITEEIGLYLELTSWEDCKLPLGSLDTTDFKLQTLRQNGNVEVAVIFVPESRRQRLHQKLLAYLGPRTRY